MFTIGLVCGGPSLERGISLNSARSVLDHLQSASVRIVPFFVDQNCDFHALNPDQLYSNTPQDFDFKLAQVGELLTQDSLQQALRACDLVFSVIHGTFGEDGQLAAKLESWDIPFVGSSSAASARAYHKDQALTHLQAGNFPTIPWLCLEKGKLDRAAVNAFWRTHIPKQGVVKPVAGGSSIDVSIVASPDDLFDICTEAHSRHDKMILQPFYSGMELTVTLVETENGTIVSLPPTATKMLHGTETIFSYRDKYLPSYSTHNTTPAPIPVAHLADIATQTKALFRHFDMSDCVRLDGWYDPEEGFICNDVNPMTGLEQSSFFFKQAACCGASHANILQTLIRSACTRQNLCHLTAYLSPESATQKISVPVLFGGSSTERQVSVLSGSNVWLKLMRADNLTPHAFFLDQSNQVWRLPYVLALHHTVEEIEADIARYQNIPSDLQHHILALSDHLMIPDHQRPFQYQLNPTNLASFLDLCQEQYPFVFLGLHGGIGEDGTIQQMLTSRNLAFNGSLSRASQLCMDKKATRDCIRQAQIKQVVSPKQACIDATAFAQSSEQHSLSLWASLCQDTDHHGPFIIKPMQDGCSSGIVRINDATDLHTYCRLVTNRATTIDPNTFHDQPQPIALSNRSDTMLIEPYIVTDEVRVAHQELHHTPKTGWLELTVVVRQQGNQLVAFTPSITVSESAVLSVEEKFQGGTGINLTPPPENLLSQQDVNLIQDLVAQCATALGLSQYARLDIFFHRIRKEMIVIEANTLPALTPSTVLYQQALVENPPIRPGHFLQQLVDERLVELVVPS